MRDDCIDHGQKGAQDGYGHCRRGSNTNVAIHRVAYCEHHGVAQRDLGSKYNTTHSNISVIVNRKTRIHDYSLA